MKKTIFFSMLLAIGVSTYANQPLAVNENGSTTSYANGEHSVEENYICAADCLFGSCNVSCPSPDAGGGGGAICTCYGGFASCACGEGHGGGNDGDKVQDVSVDNSHLSNLTTVSSISSGFVSNNGVKFHNLIKESIKRGTYKKSRNKTDIQRFLSLKKYASQLSRDEKQKLDNFVRKHSK